jgi:hypothetical protein
MSIATHGRSLLHALHAGGGLVGVGFLISGPRSRATPPQPSPASRGGSKLAAVLARLRPDRAREDVLAC